MTCRCCCAAADKSSTDSPFSLGGLSASPPLANVSLGSKTPPAPLAPLKLLCRLGDLIVVVASGAENDAMGA